MCSKYTQHKARSIFCLLLWCEARVNWLATEMLIELAQRIEFTHQLKDFVGSFISVGKQDNIFLCIFRQQRKP